MSVVQDATVLSIRPVVVDGSQSGVGGVSGGVVGGIAGSSVGGHRESAIVGVLGAVAGAVIGNAVERNATREEAVEVLVQLRNGERRAIVQAVGNERLYGRRSGGHRDHRRQGPRHPGTRQSRLKTGSGKIAPSGAICFSGRGSGQFARRSPRRHGDRGRPVNICPLHRPRRRFDAMTRRILTVEPRSHDQWSAMS